MDAWFDDQGGLLAAFPSLYKLLLHPDYVCLLCCIKLCFINATKNKLNPNVTACNMYWSAIARRFVHAYYLPKLSIMHTMYKN